MLFISESLLDEHVLDLSKRITDGNELTEFGIKVLTFKEDTIKAAMYDHSNSIHAATHELLSKWLKTTADQTGSLHQPTDGAEESSDEPTCCSTKEVGGRNRRSIANIWRT